MKCFCANIFSVFFACATTSVNAGDGTHTTQFNLIGLTDVLASKLETEGNASSREKVGDNMFRLVTGDEYVVDPEATDDPVLNIVVEDSNYLAAQAFYDADVGLKLCGALPDTKVTFDSLPIGGTAPNDGGKPTVDGALHKVYTISISQDQVKRNIFPLVSTTTTTIRGAYRKMSICCKVKHVSHYDPGDMATTRPIPLFTILFKNANVLRRVYDSRNSKVCEKQKHRYINMDTLADVFALATGPRGHPGPTKTKISTGLLRVFTPNQRVYNIDGVTACRAEYYQIAFRCSDSAWAVSKTWLPVLEHGVTAEECLRWEMERKCKVFDSSALAGINHTETLNMAQVSANQFRTNITDHTFYVIFNTKIRNKVRAMCLNRASGKMFVRNCIMDRHVPSSYSFPFEATIGGGRVVTSYGHVKANVMATTVEKSQHKDELTGEPKYGYFKGNSSEAFYGYVHIAHADMPATTLIWPKATNQLKHHILSDRNYVCPYTALLEIPVTAVVTENLEHTDIALNRARENMVKKVTTFVENSNDMIGTPHRFKVYDNQKMDADDVARLGLNPGGGKCMHNPSDIFQTYMVDGTVLLQFVYKSQIGKVGRYVARWNRNKLKYNVRDTLMYHTPDTKRKNTHNSGVSREINGDPTDLEEKVCSTTSSKYTDAYNHDWECKHGVVTLTKVSTSFNVVAPTARAPNPAALDAVTQANIHTGWYTPIELPADATESKIINNVAMNLARMHTHMQMEKLMRSSLIDALGQIDPSVIANIIFPDEDVKLTKAGDLWAVHRCTKVLWPNMRVIPSLRLDYHDMPIPTIYRNLGSNLDAAVPHLSDLCYATPIVKTLTKELGVTFMQVLNGGKELNTELNLITPCNRMDGRLHFNVGDQVVTFSSKTGEFHHAVERRTNPMSSSYNIFHTGKSDPLVKNIRTGGTHITDMVGGGTKINNNYFATDDNYVPKPDESSQFTGYHSNIDGNIRDHLLEISFEQSSKPVSPSKFLSTIDAGAVNMLNLERFKRQERDNVPHHYWPYSSLRLNDQIPNTPEDDVEEKSKARVYNRHRIYHHTQKTSRKRRSTSSGVTENDPTASGVYFAGDYGYTVYDQRRMPLRMKTNSSYGHFILYSIQLHADAFMEEYGPILLTFVSVLTLILTPTVLYLATKLAAIDKFDREKTWVEHGNTMLDHNMSYASNAVIGGMGIKQTKHDLNTLEEQDRGTKILYRTGDNIY